MLKKVELSLLAVFALYLVVGGAVMEGSNSLDTEVRVLNVSDPHELGRWSRVTVELNPDIDRPVFTALSRGTVFKKWEVVEENGSVYTLRPRVKDSYIEYGQDFMFAVNRRGETATAYSDIRAFSRYLGLKNPELIDWAPLPWMRNWDSFYSGLDSASNYTWKNSSVVLVADQDNEMPTYIKVYQDVEKLPVLEFSANGTYNSTGIVFKDSRHEVFVALSDRDRWIEDFRDFDLAIMRSGEEHVVNFSRVYNRMNWTAPDSDVGRGSDKPFRVAMYASSRGERARVEFFRVED